jgi:hypothetical protein
MFEMSDFCSQKGDFCDPDTVSNMGRHPDFSDVLRRLHELPCTERNEKYLAFADDAANYATAAKDARVRAMFFRIASRWTKLAAL